jgi:hypothetical protein
MASKIKVDQLETVDGTGNITVNQPLSGSGAGLTSLPAANLTGSISEARLPTIAWSKMATDALDTVVTKVSLKDYGEATNIIGSIGGGTQSIDLTLGNSVTATLDTSTTTFTFDNPSASGTGCGFTLVLSAPNNQTIVWPTSVDWKDATAADLTGSALPAVLSFWTVDGGTIWYGFLASSANA